MRMTCKRIYVLYFMLICFVLSPLFFSNVYAESSYQSSEESPSVETSASGELDAENDGIESEYEKEANTGVLPEENRVNVPTEDNQHFENAIAIAGIIAGLIVGIPGIVLNWVQAKNSRDISRITYSFSVFPLFYSNPANENSSVLDKLQISYNGKTLSKPYLLLADIANTGNKAIINPSMVIKTNGSANIISGYFEDLPGGYESKWSIQEIPATTSACKVSFEHINPGQTAHIRCFLDNKLNEEPILECPIPDLQVQKVPGNANNALLNPSKTNPLLIKSNIALIIITVIFMATIGVWYDMLNRLFWITNFYYLNAPQTSLFLISTLILANLFNILGLKTVDKFVETSGERFHIVNLILLTVSTIMTIFVTFNIIDGFFIQIVVGFFASFGFAIVIHNFCAKAT